jgi:hypothetical protein
MEATFLWDFPDRCGSFLRGTRDVELHGHNFPGVWELSEP